MEIKINVQGLKSAKLSELLNWRVLVRDPPRLAINTTGETGEGDARCRNALEVFIVYSPPRLRQREGGFIVGDNYWTRTDLFLVFRSWRKISPGKTLSTKT